MSPAAFAEPIATKNALSYPSIFPLLVAIAEECNVQPPEVVPLDAAINEYLPHEVFDIPPKIEL